MNARTERMEPAAALQMAVQHIVICGPDARVEKAINDASDSIATLVAADREYDAALASLAELNRKVAESGWLEVEFDAMRKACDRLVRARSFRSVALARFEAKS